MCQQQYPHEILFDTSSCTIVQLPYQIGITLSNTSVVCGHSVDAPWVVCHALGFQSAILISRHSPEETLKLLDEALYISYQCSHDWCLATTYMNLAKLNLYTEIKRSEALDNCQKAYQIFEKLGDLWGIELSLCALGAIEIIDRDYIKADEHLTRSLTVGRELGDIYWLGNTLFATGILKL